jgi:outer membrane protein
MLAKPVRFALAAVFAAGCASSANRPHDHLAERICPPDGTIADPSSSATLTTAKAAPSNVAQEPESPSGNTAQTITPVVATSSESSEALQSPDKMLPEAPGIPPAPSAPPSTSAPSGSADGGSGQGGQITLPEAIETSFRMQPRLRVFLAGVEEAKGRSDVAFAPYLPTLSGGISGGGFDLDVQGQAAGFSFLPPGAVIPIGLDLDSGYGLAEVRMQWLICDFGRRASRFCQAELGVDIARLQTERAYQTVANEVAMAYYKVLQASASRRIAQEAVRRAEDDLGVARNLEKGGVIEREKVLRAEVQLAQSQRLLENAEGALQIAVAGLNLVMGVNVTAPTSVVELGELPPPPASLAECLQTAATQRRELDVARAGMQVAQEGTRAAKADFLPKIVAEGDYFNFEQATPRSNLNLGLGFIKLEWGLFEGGRRVGELRVADSKTRAAAALADAIADTISFETFDAYRQMITAFRGIDLAKPAVTQARENYRLVKARAAQGDATAAELTDAETALTRAEQDYLNSTYEYLSAGARLDYAMGQTPGQGR